MDKTKLLEYLESMINDEADPEWKIMTKECIKENKIL
jgi:hypothetical protein